MHFTVAWISQEQNNNENSKQPQSFAPICKETGYNEVYGQLIMQST